MDAAAETALEDCLLMLIDSLSKELAFEMHYAAKTGLLPLGELYAESRTFRVAASSVAPGTEPQGGSSDEEAEDAPMGGQVRSRLGVLKSGAF
jgi:hypothetical protein